MSSSRQIPTRTLEQKHVHANHNLLLVADGCHDFECSINRDARRVVYGRLTCSLICKFSLQSIRLKQKKHENGSQQTLSCQYTPSSYHVNAASQDGKTIMAR